MLAGIHEFLVAKVIRYWAHLLLVCTFFSALYQPPNVFTKREKKLVNFNYSAFILLLSGFNFEKIDFSGP